MKTALALRHIHFEDLGTLEPLLRERGFDVRYLDPTTDDLAGEEAAASDLLIALGGPIGAFDERAYPFLADELRLLERRLASGRPLLGICLGAQLIARLLGAEGEFGKDLKLPKDWAVQIVKQVGNYGEVFEKNLGQSTDLKIDRGMNALWNNGGIQYAPPVR